MVKKGRIKSENLEENIRNRMRFAGLWWGPNDRDIKTPAKILITVYITTILTQVIEIFASRNDGKKILRSISILSFCGIGGFKVYTLIMRKNRWISLVKKCTLLETEEMNYRETVDVDDQDNILSGKFFTKHLESYTNQFMTTSSLLTKLYLFTLIIFVLTPFMEIGINLYEDIEMQSLPHILPSWSPLDGSTWGYVLTMCFEAVGSVYCVAVHVVFDTSVVSLMIFIQGQFSLLHNFSERIGGSGDRLYLNERRDAMARFRISKCHHIHVIISEMVTELGRVIQAILGTYFVLATMTLCSIAVQFTWEGQSTMQFISLLQYMCATLTQLYLFCHFGDAVLNESPVALGEGPYSTACWCLSPKVRREIAILCVGMSRQIKLKAGIFYFIDLPSFIMVVRTAYSYYAVVKSSSEQSK